MITTKERSSSRRLVLIESRGSLSSSTIVFVNSPNYQSNIGTVQFFSILNIINAVLYPNVRKDDSDKEHHRIKISFDDPKVDPIAVEADKLRFYQRIDK
jgi:hypothetical protein